MVDDSQEVHSVLVEPGGFVIKVPHDGLVMEAANKQGVFWPTSCGGEAICTRCFMVVAEESESCFAPMRDREREGLEQVRWTMGPQPGERLACQARVVGDAVVTKKFVRPARPADYLPFVEDADE